MIGIGFAPGLGLAAKAVRLGAIAAVLLILLGVAYAVGRSDGRKIERTATAEAVAEALKVDRAAREKADVERAFDMAETAETEEELSHAIYEAASTGADPALALACKRLLRLPPNQRPDIPAQCRPEGSDGP